MNLYERIVNFTSSDENEALADMFMTKPGLGENKKMRACLRDIRTFSKVGSDLLSKWVPGRGEGVKSVFQLTGLDPLRVSKKMPSK